MKTIHRAGLLFLLLAPFLLPAVHAAPRISAEDVQFFDADADADDDPLGVVPARGDVKIQILVINRGDTAFSNRTLSVRITITDPKDVTVLNVTADSTVTLGPNGTARVNYEWEQTGRRTAGNHSITIRVETTGVGSNETLLSNFRVADEATAGNLGDRLLRELGFFILAVVGVVLFAIVLVARRS